MAAEPKPSVATLDGAHAAANAQFSHIAAAHVGAPSCSGVMRLSSHVDLQLTEQLRGHSAPRPTG
jgi:hypothetical protein